VAAAYLLDSNAVIAALRGESRSMLGRLARIAPSRLQLSALVLAELLTGAEKGAQPSRARAALAELTAYMTPLPFDDDAADAYGRIRASLERKGRPIGPIDGLIAAQAVSRDLVLVTANLREFRRVPGLVCENWMRSP
jgi:tRNA(fMet)-specific endonuclease VapC